MIPSSHLGFMFSINPNPLIPTNPTLLQLQLTFGDADPQGPLRSALLGITFKGSIGLDMPFQTSHTPAAAASLLPATPDV